MGGASVVAMSAIFWVFWIIYMLFIIVIGYVLPAIFMMKLFKKARVKPWAAWVPFYNQWKFLQIGGYHGQLIFILVGGIVAYIIGCVMLAIGVSMTSSGYYYDYSNSSYGYDMGNIFNIIGIIFMILTVAAMVVYTVFQCMAAYQISKKLNKDGAFVVLYIFFSVIWMGICGLDKSTWDDKKGRKSLAA